MIERQEHLRSNERSDQAEDTGQHLVARLGREQTACESAENHSRRPMPDDPPIDTASKVVRPR